MITEVTTRGSSGAEFVFEDDQVTKLDAGRTGRRVQAQGMWLWSYGMDHTPTVHRVLPNGYAMEMLEPIELNPAETSPNIHALWSTLRLAQKRITHPRIHAPFVSLDRDALHAYVKNLSADVGIPATLQQYLKFITFPTELCWTHGDPIIDNLMLRRRANGIPQTVLIDPIPPVPAVPSLAVVDYGRVVQSAAGYEPLRYLATDLDDWQERVAQVLDNVASITYERGFDVNTIRATLFYSVIHMLRGARTAPDDKKAAIIQRAHDLEDMLLNWL